MTTCLKCGASLVDEAKFCHQCGASVEERDALPPPSSPAAGPDLPSNVAGLLAYALGIVSGVVLLVLDPYRRNPEVRFHAFQSIFFCIAWFVVNALGGFFYLGLFFIWLLQPAVNLAFVVIWIVLMVKAYQGERFKLPLIGDLAETQAGRL